MVKAKKRTHEESNAPVENDGIPRSMVIKMGNPKRKPTKALSALVRDFRLIMQPHTAARLKERKSNKLKDYFVMAGPLGVTNFFIFSQSLSGNTTLRLARTPRGPTLYFRINQYSLSRDIQKTQAHPHALTPHSPELQNPPVLVMNNFSKSKTSDIDALLTSMFQNILPTIQVDAGTSLNSVRRVLLLNRNPETNEIELRHYAVITRVVGSTRVIKKLEAAAKGQREIPNLHHLKNVAQYLVDPSASDSEGEDEVIQPPPQGISAPTTNAAQKVKKAVRMVEIGPRINMSLLKVEEGLCSGKTLYHSVQKRSEKEIRALEKAHEKKDAERAKRRKEQEENVRRKRELQAAKGTRKQRGLERAKAKEAENNPTEGDSDASEAGNARDDNDASDASDFSDFSDADEQDVENMNDYELDAEAEADLMSSESESENEKEVEFDED